jgi:carbon storage regulator
MIGDHVEVMVLAVQGHEVRVGIAAPSEVRVFRTEIYQELERGNDQGRRARDGRESADAERA